MVGFLRILHVFSVLTAYLLTAFGVQGRGLSALLRNKVGIWSISFTETELDQTWSNKSVDRGNNGKR